MRLLRNVWGKEYQHFSRLGDQARRLIVAIFLYNLISPIFTIFVNAFLWRHGHSFIEVASYNLALYVTIALGFYLNGLLLKKFPSNQLYSVSLLLGSIVIATLIFLPTISLWTIILFGLIDGIAAGMYWANRNLLTLRTTRSDNRIYFSGIETISTTASDIFIPVLIGFFITAGTGIALYTPLLAYKLLALILIVTSAGIALQTLGMKPEKESITSLWLHRPSPGWEMFRWYEFCVGFRTGTVAFFPTLIIFVFVGNEAALGTIQSLSALLSAFVMYHIAKKVTTSARMRLVFVSIFFSFFGAISFSVLFSTLGVFLFFAAIAISKPILWVSINSLNYDLIDAHKESHAHYAHVCDQEIYLNAGRVVAIALFIYFVMNLSNEFALRITPLIYAVFQILIVFFAKATEKKHAKI